MSEEQYLVLDDVEPSLWTFLEGKLKGQKIRFRVESVKSEDDEEIIAYTPHVHSDDLEKYKQLRKRYEPDYVSLVGFITSIGISERYAPHIKKLLEAEGLEVKWSEGDGEVLIRFFPEDYKRVAPAVKAFQEKVMVYRKPPSEKRPAPDLPSFAEVKKMTEGTDYEIFTGVQCPACDNVGTVKAYWIVPEDADGKVRKLSAVLVCDICENYYVGKGFPLADSMLSALLGWRDWIHQSGYDTGRIYMFNVQNGKEMDVVTRLSEISDKVVPIAYDNNIVFVSAPNSPFLNEFLRNEVYDERKKESLARLLRGKVSGSVTLDELKKMRTREPKKEEKGKEFFVGVKKGPMRGTVGKVVREKGEFYEIQPVIVPKETLQLQAFEWRSVMKEDGGVPKNPNDFLTGEKVVAVYDEVVQDTKTKDFFKRTKKQRGEILGIMPNGYVILKFPSKVISEYDRSEAMSLTIRKDETYEIKEEEKPQYGLVWLTGEGKKVPKSTKYI